MSTVGEDLQVNDVGLIKEVSSLRNMLLHIVRRRRKHGRHRLGS